MGKKKPTYLVTPGVHVFRGGLVAFLVLGIRDLSGVVRRAELNVRLGEVLCNPVNTISDVITF